MLSTEKLNKFKDNFIEQKASLLAPKHNNLVDEMVVDEADIASSLVINGMVETLSNREKETLNRINGALRRIEDGTFGYCEECEEPIGEGRLQAIPHVTTCINCAEQKEKLSKQFTF